MKTLILAIIVQGLVLIQVSANAMPVTETAYDSSMNLGSYENYISEQIPDPNSLDLRNPSDLVYVAKLTRFNMDPILNLNPVKGIIEVRHDKIILKVTEIGVACLSLGCPPPPQKTTVFEVPASQVQTNSCGVVQYEGRSNKLPVDGDDTIIRVIDNTKNTCPTLIALEPTEIQLKIEYFDRREGKSVKTLSKFSAEALKAFVELPISQPLNN